MMKMFRYLFVVSLLWIGTSSPVQSQDTTWNGAVNSDYNDLGNWSDGVPDGNDAFVGGGQSLSTSANTPDLHRMNLQNTSGLFTLGHSLTMQRLDDNHASLVGNGTYGSMRIIGGGNLTLGQQFFWHGKTAHCIGFANGDFRLQRRKGRPPGR